MRKILIVLITVLITALTYSQKDTLQVKLDSIIEEANLLYSYEKVAWNSTDLLMSNRKLKKNYGGYIIYHSNDTIYASFIDKTQKNRIAKYCFTTSDLSKPFESIIKKSDLSKIEKELLDIKIKIVNQLSDPKYKIGFPNGFNPNLVFIKDKEEYRLYIIMGTTESGVIPFGNDYLFTTGMKGNIKDWKKFHSRLIPAQSKGPNGEIVLSAIHSHLKGTPYITATDICTFRLYAELCEMKEFMVLSTANGKYFKYNLNTNKVEIAEP
ncbi:hypothetical protein [Aquimarina rubra]|uniref:Uncharacterized protein n=1 Tax=Aquimarina rubra TaxID=1920033 RepID=A0ABW5LEE4_9FLAO